MNTNTFPLTVQQHLIFAAIAVVFLVLQFIRQKYWYQPVVAAAIAGSLLIYVNESMAWYYGVGIVELLLMLAAAVLYIVQARKLAKAEKASAEAKTAEEEAQASSTAEVDAALDEAAAATDADTAADAKATAATEENA